MKIDFSVIIPVADKASSQQLRRCFDSLKNQDYPPLEIIVVIGNEANKPLFTTLNAYPRIKVFRADLSKSEARNFGAQKASAHYLVHIDIDTALDPDALKKAALFIGQKNAKAIILHEKIQPTSFFARVRALERKINIHDRHLATPQIIKSSLFKLVGGFDEEVNILDDWSLHFRLKRRGITFFETEPAVSINESSSLTTIIRRKYIRGQYIPILRDKYPEFKQIGNPERLKVYLRHYRFLLSSPLIAIALFSLKLLEWSVLFLGSLNPPYRNPYDKSGIAQTYDRIRSTSNYQIFKNFTERKALKILLNPKPKEVLEIGAGTGRITSYLQYLGIKVLPTEPSSYMIAEYLKKPGLPKPIKISAEALNDSLGKFPCLVAMRVIWHIKDDRKRAKIMQNSASIANSIIADFASSEKYKNILLHPLFFLYSRLLNRRYFRNDYFLSRKEIQDLAKLHHLSIEKMLPLDLLTPIWLNFLPKKTARKLFPFLYALEIRLSKFFPPGRWLVKFVKTQ